ncbi:hypothetical protein SODALDRAFT_391687 [Sodiomyces alkalinus F11]|uniref:Uncharacterized protein n=1 Tax=Sodiomyces alkalinus (strain CBS 110278 / VKM F-3762 / F11) TaxID=1314773 RepID=A0A3N2Q6Y0_SODAK|nr:hypothetical protein SODALDRAFT_391687 [Sodiomyces alkalinus F11]ROT42502.1 hypothetical protein SODALDRAFT_391687 [Sodiomyces alkalinus F11]
MAYPTSDAHDSELDEVLSQDDIEELSSESSEGSLAELPPGGTTGALARGGPHDNYSRLSRESGDADDTDSDVNNPGCTEECRIRIREMERQVDKLNEDLAKLQDAHDRCTVRINQLTAEKADLARENEKLQRQRLAAGNRNRNRNQRKTWQDKLDSFLCGVPDEECSVYQAIYKLSCKEENMSSKLHNIHPNLQLREPTQDEMLSLLLLGAPGPHTSHAVDSGICLRDVLEAAISAAPEDREHAGNGLVAVAPLGPEAHIIRRVSEFPGRLIHCLSRLDPLFEPVEHANAAHKLLHRFHISNSPCSLTFATKPDRLLAPLATCKKFLLLGIHAFYGLNTFAFSSIGEFGRFCNGIGQARLQRIQHVELLWVGSQFLCFQGQRKNPNSPLRYVSKRAWDLRHLGEMPSLKYLVVHINETGTDYMRRSHEPKRYLEDQAQLTKGQPNARKTRSMRSIQGIDYILQLRGMSKVIFYDFEKHLTFGGRHVIRD